MKFIPRIIQSAKFNIILNKTKSISAPNSFKMKTKKIDPKLPNNHKVQRQATATYPKIKAGHENMKIHSFPLTVGSDRQLSKKLPNSKTFSLYDYTLKTGKQPE